MNKKSQLLEYLKTNAIQENGIWKFKPLSAKIEEFSRNYLDIREKEGRLYTINQVKELPVAKKGMKYENEWTLRLHSAKQVKKYLSVLQSTNDKIPVIMDIGCGNGWFGRFLDDLENIIYIGVDVNDYELQQASLILQKNNHFLIQGSLYDHVLLPEMIVDIFIMNSSLQYFERIDSLITAIRPYANKESELHILDTHFYEGEELTKAKQNSLDYYKSIGSEPFVSSYFHHEFADIEKYNFRIMYDPKSYFNRFQSYFRAINPFYWIKIVLQNDN